MNNSLEKILVIDIEATAWEPISTRPKNEVSEIIEVGISVVNLTTLEIEESEGIIVKPTRSTISKFCETLTTISQAQVDKGVSFGAACDRLRKYYHSKDYTWLSWGDYDRKMFDTQCRETYQEYPFAPRHINLKNQFAVLHGLHKELPMEKVLDSLNLPLKGTHHRGIDDTINIAEIFIHTLKKFRK